MDVVAILLGLLGLAALVAWAQWRRGAWLDIAETIGRQTSPAFVVSLPALGVVFLAAALAALWTWGIWLLVVSVIAWLAILGSDPTSRARPPTPSEILADEPPPARRIDTAGAEEDARHRRAS
jgi:hypothetical protein